MLNEKNLFKIYHNTTFQGKILKTNLQQSNQNYFTLNWFEVSDLVGSMQKTILVIVFVNKNYVLLF